MSNDDLSLQTERHGWRKSSFLITPDLDLGNLESEYHQFFLKYDIQQTRVIMGIGIIFVLAYLPVDFQLVANPLLRDILLVLRVLTACFSLFCFLWLPRLKSYHRYERTAFYWLLLILLVELFINFTRPRTYISNVAVDLVTVMAIYFAIPTRFYYRLIPGLAFTVGDILLMFSTRTFPGQASLYSIIVAFFAGNFIAAFASNRMYFYRRQQYKAQNERQLALLHAEQQAITDDLTQTLVRRRFMELAENEFQRFKRYGRPFSLILMDIDFFKCINDTHGHQIGDQVLQYLAANIRVMMRQTDQLGRLGGDEFALLLPETTLNEALLVAERIRATCGKTELAATSGAATITMSFGVTEVSLEVTGFSQMYQHADRALYLAKESGRNSVKEYVPDLVG